MEDTTTMVTNATFAWDRRQLMMMEYGIVLYANTMFVWNVHSENISE
jgi:hypothetical protein